TGDTSMTTPVLFDDLPTIGVLLRRDPALAAAKLAEFAEAGAQPSAGLDEPVPKKWGAFLDRLLAPAPSHRPAHAFGVIGPKGEARIAIKSVAEANPDPGLANQRVKITLHALRVAAYPGSGTHQVLVDFYARNQDPTATDLHFAYTTRVRD